MWQKNIVPDPVMQIIIKLLSFYYYCLLPLSRPKQCDRATGVKGEEFLQVFLLLSAFLLPCVYYILLPHWSGKVGTICHDSHPVCCDDSTGIK